MKEIFEKLKEINSTILDRNTILDKGTILDETIDSRMSRENIIKELMQSWEKTGKIHNEEMTSKEEALKKAIAISYTVHKE